MQLTLAPCFAVILLIIIQNYPDLWFRLQRSQIIFIDLPHDVDDKITELLISSAMLDMSHSVPRWVTL